MPSLRRIASLLGTLLGTLLATLLAAGCTNPTLDFVEVHGSMVSGAVIDARVVPNVGVVPSLQPSVGIVEAVGAPITGPEDFRGVRIEWVQTAISVGATFPSSPDGPVIFYAVRAVAGGSSLDTMSSVINGGSITFTGDDRQTTSGSFSGLVLSRSGQTILTIDSGAFRATKP
jgi:hypothetical protein